MDGESGEALPKSFAGVVLFKKGMHFFYIFDTDLDGPTAPGATGTLGTWDSMHVFEVEQRNDAELHKSAHYKVSSTVMLTLRRSEVQDYVDMGGNLSRQMEDTLKVSDAASHIVNLGHMIEEAENKIRNQIQEIYFGKMHDVVTQLRSTEDLEASRNAKKLQEELVAGWER